MCINGTSSAVKSHHITRNRGETSCTTPIKWIKCYKKVLWWWAVLPPDPWFAVLSWSLHQGMSKQRCPWGWEGTDVDGGNLNVCFFMFLYSSKIFAGMVPAATGWTCMKSVTHTHTLLVPVHPQMCVECQRSPFEPQDPTKYRKKILEHIKIMLYTGWAFQTIFDLFDWFM